MSRFKGKPVQGLPGRLPPGESILWQGAPRWQSLATGAFRIKLIALYFGILVLWRVVSGLMAGHGLVSAATSGLSGLTLGVLAVGIFSFYAWAISRSSTYTITDKRVVMTYGMALPKSLNLPFNRIEAADLALQPDGTGNIMLRVPAGTRLSYLLLLPHVKSGQKTGLVPMLRAVEEPQKVAQILATALAASLGADERAVITSQNVPEAQPVMHGVAA
jgi:hypothetical protein